MLPRNISNNMLIANYGGGNGAIDCDDGSLFFDNNHVRRTFPYRLGFSGFFGFSPFSPLLFLALSPSFP